MLTIDTLPDDVFREIFAFCLACTGGDPRCRIHEWQSLAQVCNRWQETIYASLRYLDVFLYISGGDPITENLDRWPKLPLVLNHSVSDEQDDTLYNALAQRDRICRIKLVMLHSHAYWIEEPMVEQFPRLTHLDLISESKRDYRNVPYVLLDRFLGGSAPSLQHLCIDNFEYEGLPSFLLSAPNLLSLQIKNIRPTCYESMAPEVIVGALAGLTKLRDLCIEFHLSCDFYEKWQSLRTLPSPSLVHAILPALTKFQIGGDREYFRVLVASIDAPRLEDLSVEYREFDGFYEEDEPDGSSEVDANAINVNNLPQFISRTATFKHAQFRRAELTLDHYRTYVKFDLPHGECPQARLSLSVSDEEILAPSYIHTAPGLSRVLGHLAIMVSDVQHLSIKGLESQDKRKRRQTSEIASIWLPLFRLFPAVDVLHVSRKLAGYVVSTLKGTPEMAAGLLPALQVLGLDECCSEDKLMMAAEQFLSLRKQAGRPVVIVNTRNRFVKRLNPNQLELYESPRVPLVRAPF